MRPLSIVIAAAAMFALTGCGLSSVKVLDDFTGVPVSGANISYSTLDTGKPHSLGTTDSQGDAFVIVPKDADVITVTKAGYRPLSVTPKALESNRMDRSVELRITPINASPVSDFDRMDWPK